MDIFLRYAVELAIIIPDAVFIFLPVRGWLRFPPLRVALAAGVFLPVYIVAAADVCSRFLLPVIPALIVSVIVLGAFFACCVRLSPGRLLFCFFYAIMRGAFCLLFSIFMGADVEAENTLWEATRLLSLRGGLTALVLSFVFGVVSLPLLVRGFPVLLADERLERMWNFQFIVPAVATLFIAWMCPVSPGNLLIGRLRPVSLPLLLLLPLFLYLLYGFLWWMAVNYAESARLQRQTELLQMENKRYEELQRSMEYSRALRHDFRQHVRVIGEFVQSGRIEELREYLRPITEAAAKTPRAFCANHSVDALAAHYDALAEEQETSIEWKLSLPARLPMAEADYCAMLGNLVENSLAAVCELPPQQRRVSVLCRTMSDGILALAVDNPYAGKIELDADGLPRSRRKGHGIGLASVRGAVSRYGGTMSVRTENGAFTVEIVIYADKTAQKLISADA